jgi:hypothetical protein
MTACLCSRGPTGAALRSAGIVSAETFRTNRSNDRGASFEETLRLYMLNREQGLEIDAKTNRGRWGGETMDYSQAIESMQYLRDKAAMSDVGHGP